MVARKRVSRLHTVLAMLVAIGLAALAAMAEMLLGTGGDGFESPTAGDLNQSAPPYGDHGSLDGANLNIGYCLTGTDGCQAPAPRLASPPGTLPYWGSPGTLPYWDIAGGGADPNVYFQSSESSSAAVQLTIAGNVGTNVFGRFETDATGTMQGATHPLFTEASAGDSAAFTSTAFYGFSFSAPAVSGSATRHSLSGANDPIQNFASLQDARSGDGVTGEDRPFNGSDNDLIVSVEPTPTPEPGSLLLMGVGLVMTGCALGRRLHRRDGTD